MLFYENMEYEDVYFKALYDLINEKYFLFNDNKIYCETNAIFKFNYLCDVIRIENDMFLSYYDYDIVMKNGNLRILKELEYYEKNMISNGQLYNIVEKMKKKPYTKQAVITMPKSNLYKMPCLMYIYFRVINNILYCSAHMRANNAYGLSLVNMHINNAFCQYIASAIDVSKIYYTHIVDSFHVYKRDINEINEFLFQNNMKKVD